MSRLAGAIGTRRRRLATHPRPLGRHRLGDGEADHQLTPGAIQQLLAGYRDEGFGYADYAWSPGYGVSVTAPDWLASAPGLERTYLSERGWDGHQDVHAFARAT